MQTRILRSSSSRILSHEESKFLRAVESYVHLFSFVFAFHRKLNLQTKQHLSPIPFGHTVDPNLVDTLKSITLRCINESFDAAERPYVNVKSPPYLNVKSPSYVYVKPPTCICEVAGIYVCICEVAGICICEVAGICIREVANENRMYENRM